MTTQAMVFELKVNGVTFDKGMVNGVGETVYDMTENVSMELASRFNVEGLTVDYTDVSDVWTFVGDMTDYDNEGNEIGNVYTVEFAPMGMSADKFGIED